MIEKKLNKILKKVEKPSRYIGEELNMVEKNLEEINIRFALAFPDIYEVGMSHLGSHILYGILNSKKDIYCERVYSPWVDMEKLMKQEDIESHTLETKTQIKEFDFIGFTLQYEMSYTNILNILEMGNIPLLSKERKEGYPIIIAGGPCAYNPEPISEFIDIFVMGEGEEVTFEIIDTYRDSNSKEEFLQKVANIEGIYVPKYYDVEYKEDGTIREFFPLNEEVPKKIKKRIVEDLDSLYFPENIVVPYIETVHDRAMVEIFRGCTRGCRFCQAGMVYRPIRERSKDTIKDIAYKILKNTGYEEVSFSSLSTSDYSEIESLVTETMKEISKDKISISLPSLRLDNFPIEVLEEIQKVRKSGITFAPEAGSQRLRDVINKGIEEKDLLETTEKMFDRGWSTVKLYFMIGLPTETDEDVMGIKDLGYKVKNLFFQGEKGKRKGNLKVTLSTSCFVPKPFTPFQWEPQESVEEFDRKIGLLKKSIKDKKVTYNSHDSKLSFLESVIARGDRRLNKVILKAFKLGCKFDGWSDHFDYNKWMKAFEEEGVDPYFYSTRVREYDEILPWDFIDVGVSKGFLITESEKSKEEKLTVDCREKCSNCGIMSNFPGGCK